MQVEGWIKLHRDLAHHWVATDPIALSLWVHILLNVKYEETKIIDKGKLVIIKPGQVFFKAPQWASQTGIDSDDKVYRTLKKFQEDGMIKITTFGRMHSVITVNNWSVYQGSSLTIKKDCGTLAERNADEQCLQPQAFEGCEQKRNITKVRNACGTLAELYKEVKNNKNKEIKEVAVEKYSATTAAQIFKIYNQEIEPIKPIAAEKINSYIQDGIDGKVIIAAIKEASENGKRNWAYINAILSKFVDEGIVTIEQFEERKQRFDSQKGMNKNGRIIGESRKTKNDEPKSNKYDHLVTIRVEG